MKKLVAVLALLPFMACQDADPFNPDQVITPESGGARLAQLKDPALTMVPFKGSGEFVVTGTDWEQCEGIVGNPGADCESTLELTHLGKAHLTWTNCFALSADPPWPGFPYELVSETGTMVAANGDVLHWYGSVPTMTVNALTATSYVMGPLTITGGTGRFENAQGEFYLEGYNAEDLMSGTINLSGVISSVGSIK